MSDNTIRVGDVFTGPQLRGIDWLLNCSACGEVICMTESILMKPECPVCGSEAFVVTVRTPQPSKDDLIKERDRLQRENEIMLAAFRDIMGMNWKWIDSSANHDCGYLAEGLLKNDISPERLAQDALSRVGDEK